VTAGRENIIRCGGVDILGLREVLEVGEDFSWYEYVTCGE
jgi:hypothetical protein